MRHGSPSTGFSILITRAPRPASNRVATGPARATVKSRTVTSCRGEGDVSSEALAVSGVLSGCMDLVRNIMSAEAESFQRYRGQSGQRRCIFGGAFSRCVNISEQREVADAR